MPSKRAAKQTPAAVPKTPEPEPLPEWLKETPDPQWPFTLLAFSGDRVEQEIALNRAEYIALKQHLATLRGYKVPEE